MVISRKQLGDVVKQQLSDKNNTEGEKGVIVDNMQEDVAQNGSSQQVQQSNMTKIDKEGLTDSPTLSDVKKQSPTISPVNKFATAESKAVDNIKNVIPSAKSNLQGKILESPDFSSMVQAINDDVEEQRQRSNKARNLSWLPVLTDLGLLVGDIVGAKGNANVEKREAASGKQNAFITQMDNLYRDTKNKRPERIAQLLMQDFKNRLTVNNYNNQLVQQERNYALAMEKQAQNMAKMAYDEAYKKALIEGKGQDRALKVAEMAQKKSYQDAQIGLSKERNRIAASNASANVTRANTSKETLDYKKNNPTGNKAKYLDFYDPQTKQTLRVPKEKWDANYPQLLSMATSGDQTGNAAKIINTMISMGQYTPNVMEALAKDYAIKNPEAMSVIRNLANAAPIENDTDEWDTEDYLVE